MGKYDDEEEQVVVNTPKKADIILRIEREISARQTQIANDIQTSNLRIDNVLDELDKLRQENANSASEYGKLSDSAREEYTLLKRELKYLAVQNESIFSTVSEKIARLEETVANLQSGEPVQTAAAIDYEELAAKVAERIPAPTVIAEAAPVAVPVETREDLDYDVIVDKIVARLPVQEAPVVTPVVAPAAPVTVNTEIDYEELAAKVAERIPVPTVIAEAAPASSVVADIDYDLLADKVVARFPLQDAVSPDYIAAKVSEHLVIPQADSVLLDYDSLADKVAERIEVPAGAAEINYEELADKVAELVPASAVTESVVAPVAVSAEIDYDLLADKVVERVPAQNAVIDYETLAEKISEFMPMQETLVENSGVNNEVDYDYLAEKVASRVVLPDVVAASSTEVDEEDLADRIALKIGAIRTEDFDILVDDDGCASISKEIAEKLDYELIAATVAEKIRTELDLEDEDEPDYEEMANRISEKITVAGINEEAIADKAAAALSNYLPEIDTDEIADKVASQVIGAMPAVDNELISASVSEKIIESQADQDYDIVLDEDGLNVVGDSVSERVSAVTDERFNAIEKELAELKSMILAGVAVRTTENSEVSVTERNYDFLLDEEGINKVSEKVAESTDERFNSIDREISEIREMLSSGVVTVRESEIAGAVAYEEQYEEPDTSEETLVTVSEIVDEVEEVAEEPVEEVEETAVEEVVVEEPAEEIVEVAEEVVEEPVENEEDDEDEEDDSDEEDGQSDYEEFSLDDFASEDGVNAQGGVDFANMMRYNRSFIARIIQSSDDQKYYYGEVRNALLSYRKVNSNIAWGAERFHKGRETIARFKIRGKTLVLYLALDPAAHEVSVYHHKDVSDNKSVAGTPMMIKIKSPRGVKKAVRLIDEMLEARGGIKRNVPERDYAAMYPFETIDELIEDGLVKDVRKNK